jgi:hypothetical protein
VYDAISPYDYFRVARERYESVGRQIRNGKEEQWAQKLDEVYRGSILHSMLWTPGRALAKHKKRRSFVKKTAWATTMAASMTPCHCRTFMSQSWHSKWGPSLGKKLAQSARHNRVYAHCSKEIRMYTNNTRTDASRRRAFAGKDDAGRRYATPKACCTSTPTLRREDAVHFRAESIRSLP